MTSIADFMRLDHDKLDQLFSQFQKFKEKDFKKAKKYFHEFKIGLQKHIVWEEEILFPVFEEKSGMSQGPTEVMRIDHRTICDLLEKIHSSISENTQDLSNELNEILTQHNQKEENILYPWIDRSIHEEEKVLIFKKMESLPPEKYNQCCPKNIL